MSSKRVCICFVWNTLQLLRDDSELTQELASQGLILVHGWAQTPEEREELAKQLIIVLTGNVNNGVGLDCASLSKVDESTCLSKVGWD